MLLRLTLLRLTLLLPPTLLLRLTLLLRRPLPSNSGFQLRKTGLRAGFFYACSKRSSRASASARRGCGWV